MTHADFFVATKHKKQMKKIHTIIAVILITINANAQTWSPVGTGTNQSVYCLLNDTVNNLLYVGGAFTSAGGNTANRIAQWNGANWSSLGTGMDGNIGALTIYNGKLYAGGYFTTAGGNTANSIAKWNGTNWSSLDTAGLDNSVNAMTVYNNELYVGGSFTMAGGNTANYIAKWNGTNWTSVGTGMGG